MKRGRERLGLPVETPTFPMSSHKPERSLIQYLIVAETQVTQIVHYLKGPPGTSCIKSNETAKQKEKYERSSI